MNILLVDDEETILKSIGTFLENFGHRVTAFSSGVKALSALKDMRNVDLVISDIRMPRMNGIEFLRHIQIRNPGLPVLLMTGYGDESIAMQAFQGGAIDYLKKPVRLRELLKVIKRIELRRALEAQFFRENHQCPGKGEANKHG